MKKVFTILLGMILVISMVGCVCAADTTIGPSDPQEGNTRVSYTVDQGYTVTIPESIDIGYSGTISARITNIAPNCLLNITITGTSYDPNSGWWNLTHEDNVHKLEYYINTGGAVVGTPDVSPVKDNAVVLSVPADQREVDKTVDIYCGLVPDSETITYEGTYTDQLTFRVSIEGPFTS